MHPAAPLRVPSAAWATEAGMWAMTGLPEATSGAHTSSDASHSIDRKSRFVPWTKSGYQF